MVENTSTRTNRPLLFRTIISIKLRFIYSEGIWDPQYKELSFLNNRNNFWRRKKGLWLSKTSAQDVVGSTTSKLWERGNLFQSSFFQRWEHSFRCDCICPVHHRAPTLDLIAYIFLSFFSPLFDQIYFAVFLLTILWSHIFSFLSFYHSLIEYISLSFFSPLFDRIYFPLFFSPLVDRIYFPLFMTFWLPIFRSFLIEQFFIAYISFFHFTLLPSLIKSRPSPPTSTQNDSTDISWSALKGFKLQNSWLKSSDEIFGQRGQGGCMCLLLWKCNAWAATFCGQV